MGGMGSTLYREESESLARMIRREMRRRIREMERYEREIRGY